MSAFGGKADMNRHVGVA